MSIAVHPLDGITRLNFRSPLRNPGPHCPASIRNRVIIEKHSPGKGMVQRVVQDGNMMVTYGLDQLCKLICSGSAAFSDRTGTGAGWIRTMAIGTDSTAPGFSNDTLNASTASLALTGAAGSVSNKGARTLECQGTFSDGSAYTIKEVGLFATNSATGSMVAKSTLAATDQVVKGTADSVYLSHQVIFTSA